MSDHFGTQVGLFRPTAALEQVNRTLPELDQRVLECPVSARRPTFREPILPLHLGRGS
jgi:hypothetical protein